MKAAWTRLGCAALVLAAAAWLTLPATLHAQEIHFPLIQALAWIPPQEGRVLPPVERSWEFSLANANVRRWWSAWPPGSAALEPWT